jgi:hypothetical protein
LCVWTSDSDHISTGLNRQLSGQAAHTATSTQYQHALSPPFPATQVNLA